MAGSPATPAYDSPCAAPRGVSSGRGVRAWQAGETGMGRESLPPLCAAALRARLRHDEEADGDAGGDVRPQLLARLVLCKPVQAGQQARGGVPAPLPPRLLGERAQVPQVQLLQQRPDLGDLHLPVLPHEVKKPHVWRASERWGE